VSRIYFNVRLISIDGWIVNRVVVLFLALGGFAGCGESLPTVSGNLTLDGRPLAASDTTRVTIMFYPEGGGAPAAALVDSNGHYQLATGAKEGVAVGRYVAVVSATDSAPSGVAGGSPRKKVLTPAIYANPKQSGLVADVKPGSNTFDFDLKSKP
jgi:hypothetical protein